MTKDRDYYRALPTGALLDAVKYEVKPDWRELATALAERLRKAHMELEDYEYNEKAAREGY